jgi:hypothetical protein
MKITVYINEDSLQGQLCGNVSDAVNNLLATVNALASNQSVEVSVITSSTIFSKQVCAGTGLTLAQLSKADHDLFMAFKGMLDKGTYWDKTKTVQSSTSVYLYKKQSVKDTSVAEAREEAGVGRDTLLVSVPGASYTGKRLDVEKDGVVVGVPHAVSTADVFDYLTGKGIVLKYDRSKYLRLDDKQTVLADTGQFAETNHKVQGRTVYERIGKGEYWYVDNFHKDGSVHLEVFRMSDGAFLGTCDIEDVSKFKAASKKEKAKKGALKF